MTLRLATDRRPRAVKTAMSFAMNQKEADSIHGAFKPIKASYTYFNYTGGDITIIDRAGMKFTIRPVPSGGARFGTGIVVVKNYIFHDTVIIDETSLSDELSHEETVLRKAFANRIRISPNETAVDIIYTLSPEAFREFNECVYIRELDIVITKGNERVIHPFSENGALISAESNSMDSFTGLGFRWVKHDYHRETLYLNLAGTVLVVNSINDLQMDEGFYVFIKGLDHDSATRLIRMTLEEAVDKYNLTASLLDAQQIISSEEKLARDVDYIKGQQKLEIMEKEHQNKIAQSLVGEKTILAKVEELERKYDLERLSNRNEMEKRELDQVQYISKIKLEMEKAQSDMQALQNKLSREEESRRRDDYWEDRSYRRKDSSEVVKWLPGVAVGLSLLLPKLMSK